MKKGLESIFAGIAEPPLTEPVVTPHTFVSGASVESDQSVIQIIGWTRLSQLEGERERRIVARLAMSREAAEALLDGLYEALAHPNAPRLRD